MATAICLPLAPKKRSSRAPPSKNWCQLWKRGLCARESSEPKTGILHEVSSANKTCFQMHLATSPTNAPSLGYNPLIHNYYQFLNRSKMRDFARRYSNFCIPTTSPEILTSGYLRVSPKGYIYTIKAQIFSFFLFLFGCVLFFN